MGKSIQVAMISMFLFSVIPAKGQDATKYEYKRLGETSLIFEAYLPIIKSEKQLSPAMVFYFGGGWVRGNVNQFAPHAQYFRERGIACFLVAYRVESVHGTDPYEALKDAKAAFRFIRSHAEEFKIDPEKMIAAGGSAGGHLAAALATIDLFNHPDDNLSVSCRPQALVLFNPVIDISPGGYGYDRLDDAYAWFSPLHNVRPGIPPAIVFLGTEDPLIPVQTAAYFKTVMERVGSRCDLILYEGESHGFFNYTRNKEIFTDTVEKTVEFLSDIGLMPTDDLGKH